MSAAYVKRIAPLERKIYKLKRKVKDLQTEQEQLSIRFDALDLLAQHQAIVARKMDRFLRGGASEDVVKLETVEGQQLQQWPLMDVFDAMELSDFEYIKSYTPDQLAVDILSHFKQISIVYGRYKQSQGSQEAQHLVDQAVASFMHMLKAVYFFHPELIFSLKDVNLLTGHYDPPGPPHWKAAMAGVGLSSQQVKVIKQVLDIVKVQMQQLEDERRELAAFIDAMKQLCLTTAGRVEVTNADDEYVIKGARDEEVPVACTALAVEEVGEVKGLGLPAPAPTEATGVLPTWAPGVPVTGTTLSLVSPVGQTPAGEVEFGVLGSSSSSVAGGSAGSSRVAASQQQPEKHIHQHQQQQQKEQKLSGSSAGPNQCEPSSASVSFLTASTSQEVKIPLLCNDMLDQLGGTFNRWRMLSGARSASTYVWRAEQLAVVILACFPYMPMTAVLCDYLPE